MHLTPEDLSILECADDDFGSDVYGDDTDLDATAVDADGNSDAGDIGTLPI